MQPESDREREGRTETIEQRAPRSSAVAGLRERKNDWPRELRSYRFAKHILIVAIPVALKAPGWIVLLLEFEKLSEVGIAGQQLFAAGEAMIGQVVRTVTPRRHIDQSAKRLCGMLYSLWRVHRVDVEDRACIRLFRPWQKAFVFLLNQPDRAVDHFNIVLSKVVTNVGQERSKSLTRHVYLCDDFRGRVLGVFVLVDLSVVVHGIDAHLMGVRPVELAVCREIIIRITAESLLLVFVCEIEQGPPALIGKTFLLCRHRRSWIDGAITGEDSFIQEVARGWIDSKLKIAVQQPPPDPFCDPIHQTVHFPPLYDPFNLLPRNQTQDHRRHDSKQTVSADRQSEKFRILLTTA